MMKKLLLAFGLSVCGAVSTLGAQEPTMAEFNFRVPSSITPAGHQPAVPETPEDRTSTFYYSNVTGVEFTSGAASLKFHGGVINSATELRDHKWTFRRGYNDDGTKRATTVPEKYEGTYYMMIPRTTTETEGNDEPESLVTVTVAEGYIINKIELLGQTAANSPRYMTAVDPEKGALVWNATALVATWTPNEGVTTNSVKFKVPEKNPSDAYISNQIIPCVKVYYTEAAEPEPEGKTLPQTFKFKSQADVDAFTVIDANADGKTFYYRSSAAELPWAGEGKTKDDWLITPPLAMEAGKYYRIDIHCNGSTYGEQMEVAVGRKPTVEAMTDVIVDVAVPNAYTIYHYYYKASVTGNHYIGIHGKMDNDAYSQLKIKTVDVSAARESTIPGKVSNLKLLSAADGSRKADISFTAPTIDVAGNGLDALTAISVYYGSYEGDCTNLIKTLTDVTPGGDYSVEFRPSGNGSKTICVIAQNESGAGVEAFTKGYIGVNKPADVTNVRLVETETPGEVLLTWDIPEKDVDGYDINPALITYNVTDNVNFTAYNGLTTNSLRLQAVSQGEQRWCQYVVRALTKQGSAPSFVESNWVAAGTPVAAPVTEDFVGRGVLPIHETQNGGRAKLFHEADLTGSNAPLSADGDNYYACFYAYYDATPALTTGKIDLSGLDSPTLTLKSLLMGYLADNVVAYGGNTLTVEVAEAGSEEFATLLETSVADLQTKGWKRLDVALDAYAGKTVQFRLKAHIADFPYENAISFVFADAMKVGNKPEGIDMVAVNTIAPDYAEPGRDFPIVGLVENAGAADAADVEVTLMHNGSPLATQTIAAIAAGEAKRVLFAHCHDIFSDASHSYYINITPSEGETELANNVSAAAEVKFHVPAHNAPRNLTAAVQDGNVVLSWDAPEAPDEEPATVTETFEQATAWTHDNVDGWTFFDQDCGPVGLPTGLTLPGIDEGYTRMAYTVMTNVGFGSDDMARSGEQALCAFYNFDSRAAADWAISPELSGRAQTVSVWLRSMSSRYYEKVAFFYSMDSRDPSTMEAITLEGYSSPVVDVPAEWTEYSIPMPEGARFFAIEHVSNDGWVFLIDDVTYEPVTPGAGVWMESYNVYRDGEKLDETSADTLMHTDANVATGTHTYSVSAVYNTAESLPHEWVTIEMPEQSGVNEIDGEAKILKVTAIPGALCIDNPSGQSVTIYNLAGVAVASDLRSLSATVPLAAGVYLVATPATTFKVLVR